jgi:DNA-binding transcriptional MerR regulator
MNRLYSVTELARETNITPRAIRFYEDKGLLAPRRVGTTRVFSHRELGRLKIILRGKRLGFSLSEIKDYLDLYDTDPTQAGQLQLLVAKVRGRLADLERQRLDIDTTIKELHDIEHQALAAIEERSRAS